MELILKVVKSVRSARAMYNLPTKTKSDAFIVSNEQALKDTILNYQLIINTLSGSNLKNEDPPSGCIIVTVSDKVQIQLMLKVPCFI